MREFSKKYLDLLTGKFSSLNLTRITNEEEFYYKQILDSIYPAEELDFISELFSANQYFVDIGFGGGFPLLPLAFKYPSKLFTGLEARRKKADAVREIAKDLDINNVVTYHRRVEKILFDQNVVITFKAVGKIKDFLSKVNYNKNCHVIFFKGPNVDDIEGLIESHGPFKLVYKEKYEITGTEGRHILVYKGESVPRGTKKNLVKLSDL